MSLSFRRQRECIVMQITICPYLCAASRADVKVGFKSQSSSAFFNVEYVPKYNGKGTEEIYRDLAEVIYLMCAGETER